MTTTGTPALHPRRSRIISWRERTMYDDYAANAEEPIIYKRTAGYVWSTARSCGLGGTVSRAVAQHVHTSKGPMLCSLS